MKKSERVWREARRAAALALMFFCAGVCAGVWSVAAWMERNAPGGVLGFAIAAAGLWLALAMGREVDRLVRLSRKHRAYEIEREIRPRRLGAHRGTLCL